MPSTHVPPEPRRRRPLTIGRAIRALVVIGVLVTPALNAGEVLALLGGLVRAQEEAYTPLYVKALKDVCFALIALLGTAAIVVRGRANVLVFPFLVFLLFVLASALYVHGTEPQLAVAGLRWAFPVVVTFLLVGHVDEDLVARLADVCAGLLVVHVTAQVFELFFMSDWFGRNMFGLAGRVPGMFFIPNTASFFAILCLFLAYFHGRRPRVRAVVFVLTPLSVFMTQSGTGIIVYVLLLGVMAVRRFGLRRAAPLGIAVPAAAVALFPLLPRLTGRGSDYVAVSGVGRIEILARVLEASDAFPRLFGHATNTAVGFTANLVRGPGQARSVIADSTYASIVGNLGLIGLAAFLLGMLVWSIYVFARPSYEAFAFTMIFGLFGATTVVTEAYPMNLLFAVLFALYAQHSFIPFLVRFVTSPIASTPRAPRVVQ